MAGRDSVFSSEVVPRRAAIARQTRSPLHARGLLCGAFAYHSVEAQNVGCVCRRPARATALSDLQPAAVGALHAMEAQRTYGAEARPVLCRSAAPVRTASCNINAEFNLLCLAARVDFSPEAAQYAIHLVRSGSVDWQAFLARVERHYVAPLVHRNLKSISHAGVPAKVLDTLRVRSKIIAFRSDQFAAELVRLAKLFDLHGIRTIHYKGVVTAQEFYGSVTLRNFNDLDFLIHPHDLRAVVQLLEQQGYAYSQRMSVVLFSLFVRGFLVFLFLCGV